ncbi:hypothetical protein DMP28_10065 [Brucella abortus]|nr:hypothetical protein DMP28_10065 [Brucella abortus]
MSFNIPVEPSICTFICSRLLRGSVLVGSVRSPTATSRAAISISVGKGRARRVLDVNLLQFTSSGEIPGNSIKAGPVSAFVSE